MDTSERIKILIREKDLNPKTFSEACGFDRPQAIYDLIKGKTMNVSASMCERIITAFPDISRVWLLTGEGKMKVGDMPEMSSSEVRSRIKEVPLLPISAIAGPIKAYYEDGVDMSSCSKIVSPNLNAELALPVTGDSMEPMFADGSIVFIKKINEEAFIPWGHPMVLDTENGIFIKTIMPDEENPTYIWAQSLNPKYPSMHIPKYCISGYYRVLNVIKSFTTM
ncbi:MAG: hypothetical protein K2K37_08315 [Muribaculaceae bacterium]|nr:hypothetical protein [Muribaculaceae bacterium]